MKALKERMNVTSGKGFLFGHTCLYMYTLEDFLSFRDITTMKGTIVAQVDSSESFQEFCSTSCLSFYEDKQNPSKGALNKSRCTICGKLTEV